MSWNVRRDNSRPAEHDIELGVDTTKSVHCSTNRYGAQGYPSVEGEDRVSRTDYKGTEVTGWSRVTPDSVRTAVHQQWHLICLIFNERNQGLQASCKNGVNGYLLVRSLWQHAESGRIAEHK